MKKLIPVFLIVVLLLAGGAGYYLYTQSHKSTSVTSSAKPAQNSNVFQSIQDALSKSLSLQCSFTDEQNRKTTAYIKAGAIRADVLGNDPTKEYNSTSVIIKDKKMYIWDTVKKQGMVMEVKEQPTVEPTGTMQENQTGSSSSENPGEVMATLEKYKKDCKTAVLSDSLFTPPTDVTFRDLSQMMVPSVAAPTGMSQQDVQKMMQQYQQQVPQGTSGN